MVRQGGKNVFNWRFGRSGSAGQSAAICRSRCCACLRCVHVVKRVPTDWLAHSGGDHPAGKTRREKYRIQFVPLYLHFQPECLITHGRHSYYFDVALPACVTAAATLKRTPGMYDRALVIRHVRTLASVSGVSSFLLWVDTSFHLSLSERDR
ncbi:hypothetical protein EI94DRAFT_208430 [Lactarius quietus]|nr:hypothetical protein EI94DRAFT_208430 [Lactarius quietus]